MSGCAAYALHYTLTAGDVPACTSSMDRMLQLMVMAVNSQCMTMMLQSCSCRVQQLHFVRLASAACSLAAAKAAISHWRLCSHPHLVLSPQNPKFVQAAARCSRGQTSCGSWTRRGARG